MSELLTGGLEDDVAFLARPVWQQDAACRGASRLVRQMVFSDDPELQSEFIARFCYVCPVEAACRDWGLRHERDGVWGAMTQVELNRVRGQRGIEIAVLEPTAPTPKKQGCGTHNGWRRHIRNSTPVCDRCRLAHNDFVARQRTAKPRDRQGEAARRREREQRAFQEGF